MAIKHAAILLVIITLASAALSGIVLTGPSEGPRPASAKAAIAVLDVCGADHGHIGPGLSAAMFIIEARPNPLYYPQSVFLSANDPACISPLLGDGLFRPPAVAA